MESYYVINLIFIFAVNVFFFFSAICIGYFEATRGYVIYSPRRAAPR